MVVFLNLWCFGVLIVVIEIEYCDIVFIVLEEYGIGILCKDIVCWDVE